MSMGGGATTGSSNNTVEPVVAGLNVQTSAYGLVIPILYGRNRIAGNLMWYGAFTPIPVTTSTGGGGGGGKGGGGGGGGGSTSTTWVYTTSFAIGICEGPIHRINSYWADQSFVASASSAFTSFLGTYPQSAWPYLTSNFPGQDLHYPGQAYGAAQDFSLGSNSSLPNISFDVTGVGAFNPGTIDGADASVILADVLSNAAYGAGFPSSLFGVWTQMSNYCVANNLFLSPVYNNTQDAATLVSDLMDQCNCAIWFSEGLLKTAPYGDQAASGNGRNYVPNNTILYDVGDDDYLISSEADDPVVIDRKTIVDAFNSAQVEIVDAANQYNTSIITAMDIANIQQFGLRPDTSVFQAHGATSQAVGAFIAQFRLQRKLYLRSIYKFSLGWKFCGLEPMDLITLTDSLLGLDHAPVRILSVDEEDGTFNFTAEDYLANVSGTSAYSTQASSGFNANSNIDPGNTNAPLIIDGPGAFTQSGFEIWAALSGNNSNWGGCEVWISTDDASYKKAGTQIGRSRYGVLTADFPVGTDPDTTHQCKVDLTLGQGQLVGGTQSDADLDNLLCFVGGELISYESATLTALYKYTLGTYIRRGVNSTAIADHPTNTPFARLDSSIFKYAYDESLIGKTVYLKLLSFNIFNGGKQQLADVASIPFTIGGSLGAPANVADFSASQNGNVVVFQWKLIDVSNVSGYEIRFNPVGGLVWDNGTPLTQVTKGTTITTAKVPPGSWTFMIKAKDNSLQYSLATANFNLVVINQNVIITSVEQDKSWTGAKTNFVVHPTGVIAPQGQAAVSTFTWEWVDQYVPDPFPICTYEAPEIDCGSDGLVRLHGEITSMLGPGVIGNAAPSLLLDYKTSFGAYGGFQPWTIGNVVARFFKEKISLDTSIGAAFIQAFAPTADAEPVTVGAQGVSVSVGGTAFSFGITFRQTPNVSLTAVSTTGLIGVVHSVTATGFIGSIFNTSNVDVGGVANWNATGV